MEMMGSTCGFVTRYPTDDELQDCRHFELSDQSFWDPSKNVFHVSSMAAERHSTFLTSRNVSLVQGHGPSSSPSVEIRDDIEVSDYDRALANVSLGLVPSLMVERLISNVKVAKVKNEYATITDARHHGINTELIARKWGICLDRAKATLKCTTQQCIRSAVLPLTRRYRTDLMSQRLRRLSTTW